MVMVVMMSSLWTHRASTGGGRTTGERMGFQYGVSHGFIDSSWGDAVDDEALIRETVGFVPGQRLTLPARLL